MTRLSVIGSAAVLCLALAGCGTSPGDRAVSGGLLGAGVGAGAAALTGGSVGTGALIGGAGGALLGAVTSPDDVYAGRPAWRTRGDRHRDRDDRRYDRYRDY